MEDHPVLIPPGDLQLVIFDLDGTLLDTERVIQRATREFVERFLFLAGIGVDARLMASKLFIAMERSTQRKLLSQAWASVLLNPQRCLFLISLTAPLTHTILRLPQALLAAAGLDCDVQKVLEEVGQKLSTQWHHAELMPGVCHLDSNIMNLD